MMELDESLPEEIQRDLAGLPREMHPSPALEERVVRAVVPRRDRRRWVWLAAAAALVLAVGIPWWRTSHRLVDGSSYLLLLYQDSTYEMPAQGHMAERRAEYAHWADSLGALGKMERGAALAGRGAITGMFIIRVPSDSEAARVAAESPHIRYHGHVEVRRMEE
jgi:hypothetical protein